MKRIAVYVRKSVKGADKSISLDSQKEIIKNYFRNEDAVEFIDYIDDGFSGGTTNRPAFQRMMADAMNKELDIVACYKLDRIARNTLDFLTIFNTLQEYNIDLICVEDKYDPTTPAGRLMMTLLASLAEMERENIKQRAIDGMLSLAKDGRWTGGTPPFGYVVKKIGNGKYLELIEEEKVKYIFEHFLEGDSIAKLSNLTNMSATSMSRTLKNITYLQSSPRAHKYLELLGYEVWGEPNGLGYLPYGKNITKGHKKVRNTDGLKVAGVSKHKAVIDLETFIKTQDILKTYQGHVSPRISKQSFLAQMVYCQKCGNMLQIITGNLRKSGSRPIYFGCKKCRKIGYIPVSNLEKSVLGALNKLDFFKIVKKNNVNKKSNNLEKKSLKKELDNKKKIIGGLADKLGLVDTDLIDIVLSRMNSVNLDIKVLEEKIRKLDEEELLKDNSKENIKLKDEKRKEFLKHFDSLTLEEKQADIRKIISKVIVSDEDIIIK